MLVCVCLFLFFSRMKAGIKKSRTLCLLWCSQLKGIAHAILLKPTCQIFSSAAEVLRIQLSLEQRLFTLPFGEDPYTADDLVALVSTWAQSGTASILFSVDPTRLDVDPSCPRPAQLESFQAGDCESETVTGEPAASGVNVAALGGAIGTVIVLLILVIAVLVVVILLQRTRKRKTFRYEIFTLPTPVPLPNSS